MTNRPDELEDENQRRVEDAKEHLPSPDQVGKKDHPSAENQEFPPEEAGRLNETGVGRGWEHKGH